MEERSRTTQRTSVACQTDELPSSDSSSTTSSEIAELEPVVTEDVVLDTDANADSAAAEQAGYEDACTIQVSIQPFSKMTSTLCSPARKLRGINWKIMIMPKQHAVQKKTQKCMGFFLQCCPENSYSDTWQVEAMAEMKLLSVRPNSAHFVRKTTHTYTHKENDWGYSCFMTWADVLDEKQGYISNDKVTLQITVRAKAPKNLLSRAEFRAHIQQWYELAEHQLSRAQVDLALEANAQALNYCKDKDPESKEKLDAQRVVLVNKKLLESIHRIEKGDKSETGNASSSTSLRAALSGLSKPKHTCSSPSAGCKKPRKSPSAVRKKADNELDSDQLNGTLSQQDTEEYIENSQEQLNGVLDDENALAMNLQSLIREREMHKKTEALREMLEKDLELEKGRAESAIAKLKELRAEMKKNEKKMKASDVRVAQLTVELSEQEEKMKAVKRELETAKKKEQEERTRARKEREMATEQARRYENELAEKESEKEKAVATAQKDAKEARQRENTAVRERKTAATAAQADRERAKKAELRVLELELAVGVRELESALDQATTLESDMLDAARRALLPAHTQTARLVAGECATVRVEIGRLIETAKTDCQTATEHIRSGKHTLDTLPKKLVVPKPPDLPERPSQLSVGPGVIGDQRSNSTTAGSFVHPTLPSSPSSASSSTLPTLHHTFEPVAASCSSASAAPHRPSSAMAPSIDSAMTPAGVFSSSPFCAALSPWSWTAPVGNLADSLLSPPTTSAVPSSTGIQPIGAHRNPVRSAASIIYERIGGGGGGRRQEGPCASFPQGNPFPQHGHLPPPY